MKLFSWGVLPYREYPPHWVADASLQAIVDQGLAVRMVSYTDHEFAWYLKLPLLLRNMLDPWVLGFRLLVEGQRDRVLLRDLHLIAFVLALPVLFWSRKRLALALHGNIQAANTRWKDDWSLRILMRAGFRFLVIESSAGMEKYTQPPYEQRVLAVLHALKPGERRPSGIKAVNRHRPRVGLVGVYRREKGYEEIVDQLGKLIKAGDLNIELLVGCDDSRFLARVAEMGFTAVDTSTSEDYQNAINACDMLIYNFQKASYYYRSSGGIADAIASGKLVLTIDAPVIRHQIEWPVPVGACYSTVSELPAAIETAMDYLDDASDRFDAHRRARGPEGLSDCVRDQLRKLPDW